MKKDKLLKLYYYFKNKGLDYSDIIDKIKLLTDDDIDIVLKSKYPLLLIDLLVGDDFNNKTTYVKRRIISYIEHAETNQIAQDIILLLRSKELHNNSNILIICKIISESYSDLQAYCLCKAARNINVMHHPNSLELLKFMTGSGDNSINCVTELVTSKNVLKNANIFELISLLNYDSHSDDELVYVSNIIKNDYFLNSSKMIYLVKLILKANKEYQLKWISNLINDYPNIIDNPNLEAYIKVFINSSGEEQAKNTYYLIIDHINEEHCLEYAKIISECSNEEQAIFGRKFIMESNLDNKEEVLKVICQAKYPRYAYNLAMDSRVENLGLIKMISNASSIKVADIAYNYLLSQIVIDDITYQNISIITSICGERSNYLDILDYLSISNQDKYISYINGCISKEEMDNAYDMVQEAIDDTFEDITIEKTINYDDYLDKEYDFWKLFKKQPDDAIRLLDNYENIDINDNMKLKRKKI